MPITKLRGGLQISDDTVTSIDIRDGTLIAADFALGSLTGELFVDGTITADQIADGTITEAQILDRSITGVKLALDTVTLAEIDCATIAGKGLIKSPTTDKLDIQHDITLLITADTLGVNPAIITTNSNFVDLEEVGGTKDGGNTAFTLAFAPFPTASLHLFWNGVLQQAGAGNDFELSSQALTLAFAPKADDELKASYRKI